MSLAIVQTSPQVNVAAGLTATLTFSANVTAGNSVLVLLASINDVTESAQTVKDSLGNAFVLDIAAADSTGRDWASIWRQSNSPGGYTQITITLDSDAVAGGFISAAAIEVNASLALDQSSSAGGTSTATNAPGSITTTQASEIVAAVFADNGQAITAQPSGYTVAWHTDNSNTYIAGAGVSKILVATGSENPTWTRNAADTFWAAVVACYYAGGAGPTSHLLSLLGAGA
jgi:hypothetical protein